MGKYYRWGCQWLLFMGECSRISFHCESTVNRQALCCNSSTQRDGHTYNIDSILGIHGICDWEFECLVQNPFRSNFHVFLCLVFTSFFTWNIMIALNARGGGDNAWRFCLCLFLYNNYWTQSACGCHWDCVHTIMTRSDLFSFFLPTIGHSGWFTSSTSS